MVVLANKQDLPQRRSVELLAAQLGVSAERRRAQGCVAHTGDGVYEARVGRMGTGRDPSCLWANSKPSMVRQSGQSLSFCGLEEIQKATKKQVSHLFVHCSKIKDYHS